MRGSVTPLCDPVGMGSGSMHIVHTSDWHIGRRFERESLEEDQQAFLAWLAGQVGEHRVDLVLVAGDVYDRSLPAEDAVALLDEGLDEIRAAGATVLLIPGNHDSARRLGFGAHRQALGGVHVVADDQRPPVPWTYEAGGERVAVVAVPYLDPLTCPAPRPAADGSPRARTHEHVLADALDAGRGALAGAGPGPSIAVAHAYVAGASPSDSEKTLAVGGADAVAASVFAGFDYVALGHLHRPQSIGGDERIAYSGSPLPYSFSEDHAKSIRLLEVAGGALRDVQEIPVPVGRAVVTLEGSLDHLLSEPSFDVHLDDWVAARLTDTTVQVQPMERLRRRFPHVASVSYAGSLGAGMTVPFERLSGAPRAPEEMVVGFLSELCRRPVEEWERTLVTEAVAQAMREAHG